MGREDEEEEAETGEAHETDLTGVGGRGRDLDGRDGHGNDDTPLREVLKWEKL